MAKDIVLDARARDGIGRQAVRKLRSEGLLPGVIYGAGLEPRAVSVLKLDLVRALHHHGAHPLVTLNLGSDSYLAIVKEVQVDVLRNSAIHVDFLRVQEDVPVSTVVELHLTGEPAGVKNSGGILETQLRTLDIEALPRSIPDSLELDVSGLEIGDVARVGDVAAPEGVRILTDADETVAIVTAPKIEVEAAPAAAEGEAVAEGEEAAEPAAEAGEAEPAAEASEES